MADRSASRLQTALLGLCAALLGVQVLTPALFATATAAPINVAARRVLASPIAITSKRVADGFNVSAPGANTDAITDVTWANERGLRLIIQCATGTVVNLMVNRGGTEKAIAANANAAVTAGGLYVFDFLGLKSGDVCNLQVETDSIIDLWAIEEIY